MCFSRNHRLNVMRRPERAKEGSHLINKADGSRMVGIGGTHREALSRAWDDDKENEDRQTFPRPSGSPHHSDVNHPPAPQTTSWCTWQRTGLLMVGTAILYLARMMSFGLHHIMVESMRPWFPPRQDNFLWPYQEASTMGTIIDQWVVFPNGE